MYDLQNSLFGLKCIFGTCFAATRMHLSKGLPKTAVCAVLCYAIDRFCVGQHRSGVALTQSVLCSCFVTMLQCSWLERLCSEDVRQPGDLPERHTLSRRRAEYPTQMGMHWKVEGIYIQGACVHHSTPPWLTARSSSLCYK